MAAFCLGSALAQQILEGIEADEGAETKKNRLGTLTNTAKPVTQNMAEDDNGIEGSPAPIEVVIGRDSRLHGMRLCDAFARGAESRSPRIQVKYAGVVTTPACAAFPRLQESCHAAVMVTASHLPADRNGFKIFLKSGRNVNFSDLGQKAAVVANEWFSMGILPPQSGGEQVMCSNHVQYMPAYTESLKRALWEQTGGGDTQPLRGLSIVLNAGNGAGGFFASVLEELGADVSHSLHLEPDGTFPHGVPNPEYAPMYQATVTACEECHADLGIMLDTDADRCGFVTPRTCLELPDGSIRKTNYEPLNRNRLIALLATVFAKQVPGCAFVTDSVTSEGLSTFLQQLGIVHVRYLKGYMNVINKAKDLTLQGIVDAQVAIETSGHCAMQENGYLDDGTYTALKVVGELAYLRKNHGPTATLLDLITDMEELDEITELRLPVTDDSLVTMRDIFDFCALTIEEEVTRNFQWKLDADNLEGIRVRTGGNQFFMLRKSLHDPIISLQIEAASKDAARAVVVGPLLELFQREERIRSSLDMSVLSSY